MNCNDHHLSYVCVLNFGPLFRRGPSHATVVPVLSPSHIYLRSSTLSVNYSFRYMTDMTRYASHEAIQRE